MTRHSAYDLVQIVIDSIRAEQRQDIAKGRSLISDDFMQRNMIVHEEDLFPIFFDEPSSKKLEPIYAVEGRQFHIWNTSANEETQTVFVEMTEVDPSSDKKGVWPFVVVCKIVDGKIKRARQYGDPSVLDHDVTVEDVRKVVRG